MHRGGGFVGGQPGGPAPAVSRAAARGLLVYGVRPALAAACILRAPDAGWCPAQGGRCLWSAPIAHAQVPKPVRHIGGGPAAAAVLRLQHRALLLTGVPQGRVPAPARARLTGAAAWPSRVTGKGRQLLCSQCMVSAVHGALCSPSASDFMPAGRSAAARPTQ